MTPFDENAFQRGLAQLRERFLAELPQRIATLRQAKSAGTLCAELHRLAGAAGSLGFADLSQTARQLERQLQEHPDDQISLTGLEDCAGKAGMQPDHPV